MTVEQRRARAVDVELHRILTVESGPAWQAKVRRMQQNAGRNPRLT